MKRRETILQGKTAEKATAVYSQIAAALTPAAEHLTRERPYWHGGSPAEFALFFGCLAAATGRAEYRCQALRLVERAVELFRAGAGLGLHGGLSGLAWTIQFLARRPVCLDIDPEEVCARADELLLLRLLQSGNSNTWTEYDLVSGLAGQGIYLLSRLPSKKAARALRLIISRLERTAKRMADGIAWYTPARTLPEHQRRVAPRGYYNLGTAHGLPGLIGFLAGAYSSGIESTRAFALLEGAVSFVLAQELPTNHISLLPAWVAPGQPSVPCRVAWCYGDLGAAMTLLHAARQTGRSDWEAQALALGRRAARCAFNKSGVIDACVCHGAAGNGHVFHRLFRATGDHTFLTAARAYFRQALRIRGSGQKLAAYSFRTSRYNSLNPAWERNSSLLSGITGVGLALLSATRPSAPAWDGLLLPSQTANPEIS